MTKQRIDSLTTRINALSNDSVMNSNISISGLNSQLTSSTQSANQASSTKTTLSNQISSLNTRLKDKNAECSSLIKLKQDQQKMVATIQSYLSDFQDLETNSEVFYQELEQELAGNLTQLSVE